MITTRVTITFVGRLAGALGVCYEMTRHRTIQVPREVTGLEAKEVARRALYYPEGDDPAYERVYVKEVAFN
jgi:hypothetical protein